MEFENLDVIDVEPEQIDCSEPESIEQWYSASQVQRLLDLNKSALRQAIFKLTSIYAIDIKLLRRGGARATEYSQTAINAIELLKAKKFAEIRKLADEVPAVTATTAIVFVDQHNQIAATAAAAADTNLSHISAMKSSLLGSYREAGRAWGRQAAAEVQLGFTEELAAGIKKLQES